MEQTSAEVVALRAEETELLQRLDATDGKVSALQSSVADMQAAVSQAADVDKQGRRRPNLIVAKLGAKSQADADALVPQLLSNLGVTCKPAAVRLLSSTSYADAAHAAPGPHRGGSGAGRVLVKFADVQDKISIYKVAKKLQGIPFSHVHLDDDLTPAQTQIRRSRQPHFQKLWDNQQRPRWGGGGDYGGWTHLETLRTTQAPCLSQPCSCIPACTCTCHQHPQHLQASSSSIGNQGPCTIAILPVEYSWTA